MTISAADVSEYVTVGYDAFIQSVETTSTSIGLKTVKRVNLSHSNRARTAGSSAIFAYVSRLGRNARDDPARFI